MGTVGPEMMSIVGSKILRQHSNKDISNIKNKVLAIKKIKCQKIKQTQR